MLTADIDSFKSFNDRLGHEAGDEVIKAVAGSMRASLRKEDLCARWGGEEFLICLPSHEPQSAMVAAEKIRAGSESLVIEYGAEKLSASITIGLAHYREDVDLDTLIRSADQAMIGAKRAGKNRIADAG